jgi:hypothetical protein
MENIASKPKSDKTLEKKVDEEYWDSLVDSSNQLIEQ